MRQRHLYSLHNRSDVMHNRFCFLLILVMTLWPVMATSSPAQVCQHGQNQQDLVQDMGSMDHSRDCCEQACFCGDDCQCDQQQTNTFGGIMLPAIANSIQNNNIYISDSPLFYSNSPDTPFRPPISF